MQREIHKMKKVRIEYLIEQKQKANEIKQQIQQTDNQIGQMVYKLYGLKEEEIAVVEGS
jgi:hypothetical protein